MLALLMCYPFLGDLVGKVIAALYGEETDLKWEYL